MMNHDKYTRTRLDDLRGTFGEGDRTIEVLAVVGRDVHVRLSKPGEPDHYIAFDAGSVADVSSRYRT